MKLSSSEDTTECKHPSTYCSITKLKRIQQEPTKLFSSEHTTECKHPPNMLSHRKIEMNSVRTHDPCLLNSIRWSPKTQRPQKNGGVRRNIMRGRNNAQNWEPQVIHVWETSRREPQDVHVWEMSRAHPQNNWWLTNQLDITSYLQLPPIKFQEKRKHVVNYEEEEDLSWCNKCGEPGHVRAF